MTIESEIALLIMSGQRVERDVYTLIMVGGERERLVRNFSNNTLQYGFGTIKSKEWNCRSNAGVVAYPRRKGCVSASLGVIRLAGSRARHLSNRSTNDVRSLLSSSFI